VGLVVSGDTLYGTAYQGGSAGYGTVFKVNTDGTGFATLHSFTAFSATTPQTNSDGALPLAGLILSGRTLYGTASCGGSGGLGTVFKVNTDGTGFATTCTFTKRSDGVRSCGSMVLLGNTLFGTAEYGGSAECGTVFALHLSIPLNVQMLANALVLSWNDPTFALQAAPFASGSFTNIPGATSPYTNTTTGPQMFFRLLAK
jgi:uncharacterized repeat protein (TIGR03803 family)